MKRIDLLNIKPFEPISSFNIEGESIDLHNKFTCTKIEYEKITKKLLFHFESDTQYILLLYRDAILNSVDFYFSSEYENELPRFDYLSKIIAVQDENDAWIELPKEINHFEMMFTNDTYLVVSAHYGFLIEGNKADLSKKRSLEAEIEQLKERIKNLGNNISNLANSEGLSTKDYLINRKKQKQESILLKDQLEQKEMELREIHLKYELLIK
jgi:hypothetical protein